MTLVWRSLTEESVYLWLMINSVSGTCSCSFVLQRVLAHVSVDLCIVCSCKKLVVFLVF